MTELNRKFELFARKMKAENLPDIVIKNFRCYYNRLAGGETGLISEKEILPMDALADIQAQPEETLSRIGGEKTP